MGNENSIAMLFKYHTQSNYKVNNTKLIYQEMKIFLSYVLLSSIEREMFKYVTYKINKNDKVGYYMYNVSKQTKE